MILHTITEYEFHWKRADGNKVSNKLIRELIGESIPPLGLEKIFLHLSAILRDEHIHQNTSAPIQKQLCLF